MAGRLLLVLLWPLGAAGQRYTTSQLRAKADSVLAKRLGAAAFAHARYDARSYYEYKNLAGTKKYANFTHRPTRGRFSAGEIRYTVLIPYPGCPAFDTIKGFTGVRFDQHLRVVGEPYTGFIPAFYWTGEPCQLLVASQALAIARQLPLQFGIRPPETALEYDASTKAFTWSVFNYLSERKDYENKPMGEVELVKMDALTGGIKLHQIVHYGVLR